MHFWLLRICRILSSVLFPFSLLSAVKREEGGSILFSTSNFQLLPFSQFHLSELFLPSILRELSLGRRRRRTRNLIPPSSSRHLHCSLSSTTTPNCFLRGGHRGEQGTKLATFKLDFTRFVAEGRRSSSTSKRRRFRKREIRLRNASSLFCSSCC